MSATSNAEMLPAESAFRDLNGTQKTGSPTRSIHMRLVHGIAASISEYMQEHTLLCVSTIIKSSRFQYHFSDCSL